MANSEMDYIHGYMADQTYDPTSMNAQSGIAVNEALGTKLKNLGDVAKSSSKVYNLAQSTRAVIYTYHTSTEAGFTETMVTANKAVDVKTSSSISFNVASNQLTIANNSGAMTIIVRAIIFDGDITPAT